LKPRIGFFDFTGCEGCQLSVLNLETQFLELVGLVEIAEFREVLSGGGGALDIAFVEGSVCGPEQAARLREIRDRSRLLVALGACADTTGVNALARLFDPVELAREVYGDDPPVPAAPPQPVAEVVTVDARVPGCPIDGGEFLAVLKALLIGGAPELPGFSVCVECKLAELPCAFEVGQICLGPVTRAGCRARCLEGGDRCRGCRGLVDNPREEPYYRLLEERGLTTEEVLAEFRTFNLPGRGGR
jgi:coenzyme F420-reducing hydrogenase gamma subunit